MARDQKTGVMAALPGVQSDTGDSSGDASMSRIEVVERERRSQSRGGPRGGRGAAMRCAEVQRCREKWRASDDYMPSFQFPVSRLCCVESEGACLTTSGKVRSGAYHHPPQQFATACCAVDVPMRLPVAPWESCSNAPTLLVGDGTCRAPWPRRCGAAGLRGLRLPLCAAGGGLRFATGAGRQEAGVLIVCDARAAGSLQRSSWKHLERR